MQVSVCQYIKQENWRFGTKDVNFAQKRQVETAHLMEFIRDLV